MNHHNLHGFGQQPVNTWHPPHGLENHWMDLIRWGLVLWRTRSLAGVESMREALGAEIATSGGPTPETLAELSGAGLCVSLGAIAGERIPRSDGKTADWRMVWPEDASIDVEVTVARRKKKHVECEALAINLANALYRTDRDFDLIVELSDPTNREDQDAIVTLAKTISAGDTEEIQGRWQLRAEKISREPGVIWIVDRDARPLWWSAANARCFLIHGEVATPDSRRAPPHVRVSFGVPYESYINPVMRKANFPQGTAGIPFLIALDVSNLPGAFTELPRAVAGFLPIWQVVSGILLFNQFVHPERVGWQWRLLRNPYAAVPLPDALCVGRADLPQVMETGVRLVTEHKDTEEHNRR